MHPTVRSLLSCLNGFLLGRWHCWIVLLFHKYTSISLKWSGKLLFFCFLSKLFPFSNQEAVWSLSWITNHCYWEGKLWKTIRVAPVGKAQNYVVFPFEFVLVGFFEKGQNKYIWWGIYSMQNIFFKFIKKRYDFFDLHKNPSLQCSPTDGSVSSHWIRIKLCMQLACKFISPTSTDSTTSTLTNQISFLLSLQVRSTILLVIHPCLKLCGNKSSSIYESWPSCGDAATKSITIPDVVHGEKRRKKRIQNGPSP